MNIKAYKYGIIIADESSKIYLYDNNLKIKIKEIDLNSLQFKLFSYIIVDVVVGENSLLISTKNGDVV